MALTDYTSLDEIRAALGVSDDELEDATISLPLYEYDLLEELEQVDPTFADQLKTLKAAPDQSTLTAVQKRLVRVGVLFSTYAVAKHLTVALPLFSPQDITDGKAAVSRYAKNPYESVIKQVQSSYERWRVAAVEAFADLTSAAATTTTRRTWLSGSAPSSDPVTGT